MSDDRLRELGKQLPWDRPDAERREGVRSALLVAATQGDPSTARKRWILAGGGFLAGALAAAAIALLVIAPRDPQAREAHARIDAPSTANIEHTVSTTPTGTDEVVRVRTGTVKVAVPRVEKGDRVRMQTADAEVEGVGSYEAVVVADRLERVTVNEGSANVRVRVDGKQQQVFLAAGQTWRAAIVTAQMDLPARPATTEVKDETAKATEVKNETAKVEASVVAKDGAAVTKDDAAREAGANDGANVAADRAAAAAKQREAALAMKVAPDEQSATSTAPGATKSTAPGASTANATGASTSTGATKSTATSTASTGATKSTATSTASTGATKSTATSTGASTATGASTGASKSTTGASTATDASKASSTGTSTGPKSTATSTPTTTDEARMPAVTTLTPPSSTAKRTTSKTEQHFQAGWALLRAGKAREAAVELGAAADAGGDDPLAADARYFQGVALVRAGQGAEAERVLVAFLDKAPTSLRRGRAAILLGKLIRDRGDTKSARAWFESALGDSDPAIAAAAKAHLDALSPRR